MQFIKSKWPTLVLILAIIVAVGFLTKGFFIGSFLNEWRQQRLMDELERPYKTDTYGGKTPEETFNMFLTALKSGDVELASKYLGPGDRERWLESFNKKSESDKNKYIQNLISAPNSWKQKIDNISNDSKQAFFTYSTYEDGVMISIPNGSGGSITKVWNISQI